DGAGTTGELPVGRRRDSDYDLPDEDLDPPLPLIGRGAAEPDRSSTRFALLLAVVLVIAALVLGAWGLSKIGQGSQLPASGTHAQSPPAVPTPGGGKASGTPSSSSPSSSSSPTHHGPLKITGASLINQSSGADHPELLAKSYDGDPSTQWYSSGYASTDWGNLKAGMGVAYDLGSRKDVTKVLLNMPSFDGVKVYVGDSADTTSATELQLGSTSGDKATATAPGGGVKGQYVIVWFDKATVPNGSWHRVEINDVSIR
ncbi:MAG TPA: hypothetical protein VFL99_17800, partial [Segeticoccus sp.]|uniref:hypothetical protein n=1 Tax=Segeticoccus sp. TaxID=2706531 RepID=UPI002D800CF8